MFTEGAVEGSIIDRFIAVVRRFPARLAVQDTTASLTYADLAALAERISQVTAAASSGKSGPIAILLPTDSRFLAAMLGVMAAGRAYVPLDAEFPAKRNRLIVAEAGACAVVSSGSLATEARKLFASDEPVIDIEDLSDVREPPLRSEVGAADLAAIYYTSGSTGRPRGIAWDHQGILYSVGIFSDLVGISCADRTLMLTSLSMFASYRAVYCALLNGASVHILSPRKLGLAPMAREIRRRGITICHALPLLLRRLADGLGPETRLNSVRLVCFGGDCVQWSDFDACRQAVSSDVPIYTSLSSTETATSCYGFLDETLRATASSPPVGRPAAGWDVTIVGDDGEPVLDGEVGEIVVSSSHIALGYWDGAAQRVRSFPRDPADSRKRIFQTGDCGRRRPDGLIEFVGRKDRQIKLRGHRIEPAEVERALTALPHVQEAAVLVRSGENGVALSLVAYVVLRYGIRRLLPRHIQALLAQRLPRFMIPAEVLLISELPRLPNLKLDRRSLLRLDADHATKTGDLRDRSSASEIAEIFESVIGVGGATPYDTIASLGGDSLHELHVFAELERRYGVTISEVTINRDATIGAIARWIARQTTHLGERGAP